MITCTYCGKELQPEERESHQCVSIPVPPAPKSLRDELAMAVAGHVAGQLLRGIFETAMKADVPIPNEEELNSSVAMTAYQIADAMLKEREKKKP